MSDSKRSKRLERRYLEHVARVVQAVVDEKFDGVGRRFAEASGISQGHVSQILRGGNADRGIGLPVLIEIRDYLAREGRPMTLDELLDLDPLPVAAPPPPSPEKEEIRLLREQVERLVDRLPPLEEEPERRAPPGQRQLRSRLPR